MVQVTYTSKGKTTTRLLSATNFPTKLIIRLGRLGVEVIINSVANPSNTNVSQLASDDTVDLTDLIQSKSALIYGSYCDPKDLWPKP